MVIGSPPEAAQAAGSIDANSSTVSGCHDQRRLSISSRSGASESDSTVRTVNRRMAFTMSDLSWFAPMRGNWTGTPAPVRAPGGAPPGTWTA